MPRARRRRQRRPGLGPDARPDDPADDVYDRGIPLEHQAEIDDASFGCFLGHSNADHDNQRTVRTLWRPDPAGGWRAYALDVPDAFDVPFSDIRPQATSPDCNFVIGWVRPRSSDGAGVVWAYDPIDDAYHVDYLPGTIAPEHAGYPYVDESPIAADRRDAPAFDGRVRDAAGDNQYYGWFYSPTDPRGFVWGGDIFPPELYEEAYVEAGRDDFTVVDAYIRPEGDEVLEIVVWDEDAPYGLRLIDVPDPNPTEADTSFYPNTIGYGGRLGGYGQDYMSENDRWDRPVIWERTARFAWTPSWVMPDTWAGRIDAMSAQPMASTDAPLLFGNFDNSAGNTYTPILVPTSGGYVAPVFQSPPGFDEFYLYEGRWPSLSYDEPETSGFAFGLIGGSAENPDGEQLPIVQVPEGDGTFTPIALPLPASYQPDSLDVQVVGAGPVIYGYYYDLGEGGQHLVAWWFPGGDLHQPTLVELLADYEGADGSFNNDYTTVGGIIGADFATWDGGQYTNHTVFFVPGPDGVATRELHNDPNNNDSPFTELGFPVAATEDGPVPWVLDCPPGDGGVSLDRWQVLYRTDAHPSFGFQLAVPDACNDRISNTATISTTSPEISSANDQSTAVIDIETSDVAVAIEADRASASVGDQIRYTIVATNDGPDPARDVVIDVQLPANDGVSAGQRERFFVGTLAAGASPDDFDAYAYVGTADPYVAYVATATVETSSIDCDRGDDSASATTLSGELPNVKIDVAAPPVVSATASWTATITVSNDGNAEASAVTVDVALPGTPTGFIVISGGSHDDCALFAGALSCDLERLGVTRSGESPLVIEVTFAAATCDEVGGALATTAHADAELDVNAADNDDAAATSVLPVAARLELTAFPGRGTVETGDALSWFVHYRNAGSAPLAGAILSADLPAGTTLVAGSQSAGATRVGDALELRLGELAPGEHGVLTFATTVTATSGALGGVASITTPEGGACPIDVDYAAATVAPAGLHIAQQASAAIACGERIGWVITVVNDGGATYDDVTVSDTPDAATPYVPGSIAGPGASASGGVLTWTLPALAPGAVVTLGYETQAPVSNGALVTNVATLAVGGEVIVQTSPVVVRGDCNAPLRLAKRWTATCQDEGPIDVTLAWVNAGQAPLANVRIDDAIGDHLALAGAPAGAIVAPGGGSIGFALGTLLPGQGGSVTFTLAGEGAPGDLVFDSARIRADGIEPQASNQVVGAISGCDDHNDCTADACAPFIGCVSTPIDSPACTRCVEGARCDDVDDCTENDTCTDGVCAGSPVAGKRVSCGDTGVCATVVGTVTCEGGVLGDDCDELLPPPIEVCDGASADEDCDGEVDEYFDAGCDPAVVYYAIVADEDGTPVGTVRCFLDGEGGSECDTKIGEPDELEVYPALLCPAVAP